VNLTRRGRALAGAGLACLLVTLTTGAQLPAIVAVASGLMIAAAARRARTPEVSLTRETDPPVAREGAEVTITVDAEAAGPVEVHETLPAGLDADELPVLAPDDGPTRYTATGRIPRRFQLGPARLAVRDELGLVEARRREPGDEELVVLPRTTDADDVTVASMARMLSGAHQTGQSGLGSDFYALRGYRDGDSIRQVNWKASARTGDDDLIVNERERESHARVTVLFDGREVAGVGTRGTNAWVLGTRATASIAEAATQLRDDPRLVVYGPDEGRPVDAGTDEAGIRRLLEPLLSGEPAGKTPLARAVSRIRGTLEEGEPVVIVSHLLGDPTIPDAVLELEAAGAEVALVSPDGASLLAAAGEPDERVQQAREIRRSRLDRIEGLGAFTIDWNPEEPLRRAVDHAVEVR
jgi:uncharacterized protein (DUF58 family)